MARLCLPSTPAFSQSPPSQSCPSPSTRLVLPAQLVLPVLVFPPALHFAYLLRRHYILTHAATAAQNHLLLSFRRLLQQLLKQRGLRSIAL